VSIPLRNSISCLTSFFGLISNILIKVPSIDAVANRFEPWSRAMQAISCLCAANILGHLDALSELAKLISFVDKN